MKPSTKAIIYSAVIFPGAGYFILKDKKKGFTFAALSAACLIFILFDTLVKANTMANQLVQKFTRNGLIDIQALSQTLSTLPSYIREQLLVIEGPLPANFITGLTIVLGVIWVASLAGCYYQGKKYDQIHGHNPTK